MLWHRHPSPTCKELLQKVDDNVEGDIDEHNLAVLSVTVLKDVDMFTSMVHLQQLLVKVLDYFH